MKEIQEAIAKLITIKNVVIFMIVGATLYFVYVGRLETAIISTCFTTVIMAVLAGND